MIYSEKVWNGGASNARVGRTIRGTKQKRVYGGRDEDAEES